MKRKSSGSIGSTALILLLLLGILLTGCGQPSLYTIINGPTGEPLRIAPGSVALLAQTQYKFGATGGQPPYTYSVLGGGGTVDPDTGVFTAGLSAGETTVRVTDAYGNTEDAEISVTLGGALTISPSALSITVNSSVTFGAFGGVPPYTYSLPTQGTGTPSITTVSDTGEYTAGASTGTDIVRVTDAAGSTSDCTVNVSSSGGVLGISPSSASINLNGTVTVTGIGGIPGYTYSSVTLLGGTGENFDTVTGTYTAPSDRTGTVTLRVEDSTAATADATITVSPAYPLAISPAAATVGFGSTLTFSASGGVPPYTFTLPTPIGGTGENLAGQTYTAPSDAAGNATIRVTDGDGVTDDAVVTVGGTTSLSISPVTVSLDLGDTIDFSAFGGEPPYSYSLPGPVGGAGESLIGGTYTAPTDTTGTATVRVSDNAFATADATVTVAAGSPLEISPSSVTIHPGDTLPFSGFGGVPPYSYSLATPIGGTGEGVSGSDYTAPSDTIGTATVRITDNEGTTADAAVTVSAYTGLGISPSSISLDLSDTITFSGAGGVSPYTFSLTTPVGGTGENLAGQTYTAPSDATGTGTVRITDNVGTTADASITVTAGPALTIHPSSITLTLGDTIDFSASGGVPGYTYTLQIAAGGTGESLVGGTYTAPSDTTGSATVRVTDNDGTTRDATITITESSALAISPTSVTLNLGDSILATASGGVPPYTFTLQTPIGGTGENLAGQTYTAPSDAVGNATVRVQDNIGSVQDMTITVTPAASLAISPSSHSMSLGENITLTASGGVPPYTFSAPALIGGSGENLTGASYQAPFDTAGSATVRVTDNDGASSDASITVVSSVSDVTRAENPATDENLGDNTNFDGVGVLIPGALTTITGNLGPAVADWFQINTGVNAGLWFRCTWSAAADNFDLALYDATLTRLGESVEGTPHEEEMIWTLAPGAVYYVVVDCETWGLPGGNYTLTITGVR
jgi:plastocyanin